MAQQNFVQVNPTAANQESDSTYQGDNFVTGGAAQGAFFNPATANKFFYQTSTMMEALAYMLKLKGYSPVDGTTPVTDPGTPSASVIALATVLANLLTNADLTASLFVALSNIGNGFGVIRFTSLLDNLQIEWNEATSVSSGSPQSFVNNFPTHAPVVIALAGQTGVSNLYVSATTTSSFTVNFSGPSTASIYYIAIGN
jgi:hypothetical protein